MTTNTGLDLHSEFVDHLLVQLRTELGSSGDVREAQALANGTSDVHERALVLASALFLWRESRIPEIPRQLVEAPGFRDAALPQAVMAKVEPLLGHLEKGTR